MLETHIVRIGADNTGALLRDPASGRVAVVDAGEAGPVLAMAKAKGWTINEIWITHEHGDHIAGVAEVKATTGARVIGPRAAAEAGAPVDQIIAESDVVKLGEASFQVWETPGHSAGHVCFVSANAKLALVGDVLFPMGCGRVFLGAPGMPMLWRALSRLKALPDDVSVITGHDYTLSNARFAAAMDPANAAVIAALAEAETAKAQGRFWSVTTIGAEKATNPFLRADQPALAAAVGMVGRDAGEVFAALREAKNKF